MKSNWSVFLTKKAQKQFNKLSDSLQDAFYLLLSELEELGPYAKNWPNFGKLKGTKKNINLYHCHIYKGKPTVVVCWELKDKKLKILEIYYVGTHEKAPY